MRRIRVSCFDILQSNVIIWVEGPSDRIYLKHWLKAFDDRFTEGVHYTIMFYGGGLISHLSVEDNSIDKFIKLQNLNRNMAIVFDSDKNKSRAQLKPATKRLRDEMSKGGGVVWITKGREIENYIPHDVIQKALKTRHPKTYKSPLAGGGGDLIMHIISNAKAQRLIPKEFTKVLIRLAWQPLFAEREKLSTLVFLT